MDKNVLQEKQRLLKEKENFEHRETHLGQGVADLFNKVVPAHELPKEVEFDKVIVPDDKAIVDEEGHELLPSKADLVNGKVPAEELPSYVDDVINGYLFNGAFFADAEHTEELEAEEGKIYVDLATNHTYRYSGVAYVQVGGELPTAVNGRFLHANDSTGALEWSEVSSVASAMSYLTVAPESDNTSGNLIFVVLDEEPLEYFNGYYYIITEANL